jgi:hypothetical protein
VCCPDLLQAQWLLSSIILLENFPKEHIAKYRAKEMTDEFNEQVFDFIDDSAVSLINNRFINKEVKTS